MTLKLKYFGLSPLMQMPLTAVLAISLITVVSSFRLAHANPATVFNPTDYVGVDRYYNKKDSLHFFSISAGNVQLPARYEVEQYDYFYLQPGSDDSVEPLYQCYRQETFYYSTQSNCENEAATNQGMLGYISLTKQPQTTALYRLFQRRTGDHFYTVRINERDFAIKKGYNYEGITGYVWVPPMYITPIYEGADEAIIVDMIETLSPNGDGEQVKLGWSKSSWYLNTDAGNAENDYAYDTSTLDTAMEISEKYQLPLTINMNGGRWMNMGELPNFLSSSLPFFNIKLPRGEQLLTAVASERKRAQIKLRGDYQGVEGGIFSYQVPDSVPLYRFKRSGSSSNRIYTTDEIERETLAASGQFVDEGIAGYVLTTASSYKKMPVKPLYRLSKDAGAKHYFTASESIRQSLIDEGWQGEGVTGYLTASPWVAIDNFGYSLFTEGFGQQFVSMSRLNKVHYFYKKRNLQAASEVVKEFFDRNQHLLASVSTDSESLLSDPFGFVEGHGLGDYSEVAIEEWRQWLTGTGIYDAQTGEYAGQARKPTYSSIDEFNQDFATSFNSWEELEPPRNFFPQDFSFDGIKNFIKFWSEWREWGIRMLDHHIQDMGDWIAETGIPPWKIYAHQTPALLPKVLGDSFATAEMFDGTTVGITMYDLHARPGNIFYSGRHARELSKHAGIFEWNPADLYLPWLLGNGNDNTPYDTHYGALHDLFNNTYRVIAPNAWPVDHNFPSISIKDRPLGEAIRNFILEQKN